MLPAWKTGEGFTNVRFFAHRRRDSARTPSLIITRGFASQKDAARRVHESYPTAISITALRAAECYATGDFDPIMDVTAQ